MLKIQKFIYSPFVRGAIIGIVLSIGGIYINTWQWWAIVVVFSIFSD